MFAHAAPPELLARAKAWHAALGWDNKMLRGGPSRAAEARESGLCQAIGCEKPAMPALLDLYDLNPQNVIITCDRHFVRPDALNPNFDVGPVTGTVYRQG